MAPVHRRSRLPGAIFFPATLFVAGFALFAKPGNAATNAIAPAPVTRGESPATGAPDPYDIFEKLGDREHLPRLLTTEDAGMSAIRPESLQPVSGDFDRDGRSDMAIAGVYNLPRNGRSYFLLVAGDAAGAPRRLHAEDGAAPFFLHRAGATGNGDPGDQAFSVSSCMNCETGVDFRWDPAERRFRTTAWKPGRMVTTTRVVASTAPAAAVPEETVDRALRIAGALRDVQAYVAELKVSGGALGTRVERVNGPGQRVRVLVFEKLNGGEKLYDAIEIDLAAEKVVGRKRG